MNKISQRFFAVVLSFVMIVIAIIFGPVSKEVQAAKKASGKVTSISVSNLPAKTLTLKKGNSKVLKVSVKTSDKKVSKAYTFKSSKPSVVKVAKKGKNIKVTAKKKGKATITIKAKAGGKKTKVKVTVGTPVSKVTINETKATLEVGKTVQLTAKATPKKASNKKIVWKSSNKKVATVNAKGLVKGVKAGTAKITAHAADGSGKKKTCSVTVTNITNTTNITNIQSAEVLNEYSIKVTLSKAQQLTASNFVIKTKSYDKGAYVKNCEIDNVSTDDKKVYYIVLASNNLIKEQNLVQINVSGLSGTTGTKSIEIRYVKPKLSSQSETIETAMVNNEINRKIYVDGNGYSKLVSVTGLPSGMQAIMSDNSTYVLLYGKVTVAGRYNVVITTQDELGNTYKKTVIYLIGSSDSIVAAALTERGVVGTSSHRIWRGITTTGGSGSYTYEIIGEKHQMYLNDNYVCGTLIKAGTYKVTVRVTDAENTNLSIDVIVTVELRQGYTVTGVVRDASGEPIRNAHVYFVNKDEATLFPPEGFASTKSDGEYSYSVVAGTYDVYAEISQTKKFLYSVVISSERSGLDFTLPVYKIVINSNNDTVKPSSFGTWKDTKDKSYGSGSTLYLKKGTYSLTTTGNSFTARLNITVSKSQEVTAAVTTTG